MDIRTVISDLTTSLLSNEKVTKFLILTTKFLLIVWREPHVSFEKQMTDVTVYSLYHYSMNKKKMVFQMFIVSSVAFRALLYLIGNLFTWNNASWFAQQCSFFLNA